MDRLAVMIPMARPSTVRAVQYTPEELARYELIVQRYARHVYNIAYRLAGNASDARDLSQEAFLRVSRALRRVQPDAPLESWLYRIVNNLYIDLLRKRPRSGSSRWTLLSKLRAGSCRASSQISTPARRRCWSANSSTVPSSGRWAR